MQQPLQITFRDLSHSDGVEQHIRDKISQINKTFNQLISCKVEIEQTQKHKNQGKLHNVRIHVAVPDKYIDSVHNEDENLYKAIQKALDSIRHQLDNYSAKIRGQTKTHPVTMNGVIIRIFADDYFGFIAGPDGNEYYFNLGNLNNSKFNRLEAGNRVHFIPRMGNEGPQARRVCVV